MYLNHFGLTSAPFSITPDTSFAFASRCQQEALAMLTLAPADGQGFIKITGEVGTGKTLACRRLLAALTQSGERVLAAYIPNPCMSARSLLLAIAAEFRLPLRANASEHDLLAGLTDHLLACAAKGRRVVVGLDEAQAMPVDALESLRLLSNLETERRKLIQIVLFAQPELDEKLARHDLRQLASRIGFQYRLGQLSQTELDNYLVHRLRVAGHHSGELFDARLVARLHRATGGLPRLANIVAHKALLLAYGEGARRIDAHHLRRALADTPSARRLGWIARLLARCSGRRAVAH
jgi:MSHA biogenesis protein MshM